MRLICPNCEAQYDVSDDAIPPGGRDVQCSNCQLSWFQTDKPAVPGREAMQLISPVQPGQAQEPEDAAPESGAPEREPETQDAKDPAKEGATTGDMAAESADSDSVSEDNPEEDAEEEAPAPAAEPARRPLDDAVANILREEAARSGATAAAAVAPATIAKPPATEKPKAPINIAPEETLQRIAQMTADEGGTRSGNTPKATASQARTKQETADEAHLRTVPSINEINATLRARAQANDTSGLTEEEKAEAVQRKGFRRGFFWVLILLAILILPYVFADQITETLPQTADIMGSYVITVDGLRLRLSEFVSGLTNQ